MWPELGTTPVALWGGTLCMQGRFVRGTVLERDASYEGALFMRGTVSCILQFLGKLRSAFNAD